jgi:hypothetical protein
MGWKRKGRRLVTAVPGVREGGGEGVVDPVPRRTSQYYAVARSSKPPPIPPSHTPPTNLPQDRLGSRRAERDLRVPRRTTAHFGGPVSPRRSSQSPGTLRHARILSKPRRATPDRVVSRRPSRATQYRAGCRGISQAPAMPRRLRRTAPGRLGPLRAFSGPRRIPQGIAESLRSARGYVQALPGRGPRRTSLVQAHSRRPLSHHAALRLLRIP